MQACDAAIQKVQTALSKLDKLNNPADMQKLIEQFGPSAATPEGLAKIKNVMESTLRGLEYTKSAGGANLDLQDFASGATSGIPATAAAVSIGGGKVIFSKDEVQRKDISSLAETMTHEMSHAFAGTKDHWYLDGRGNHTSTYRPGGQERDVAPNAPTFANAVDNADDIARAVSKLSA